MSIQARKPEARKGNQAEGRVCALRHHRETERIVVQTTSGICSRVRNHLLFLVNRVNLNLKTLEIGRGEFEEEESRHLWGNLGLLRLLPSAQIWARCENRPKRGQDVAGLDDALGQGAEPPEHQFQMTFGTCYKTLFTIFTINPFSQGFSHRAKPVTKATVLLAWLVAFSRKGLTIHQSYLFKTFFSKIPTFLQKKNQRIFLKPFLQEEWDVRREELLGEENSDNYSTVQKFQYYFLFKCHCC